MTHIVQADYSNPEHAGAIVELLNAYACDPMGGGVPLSDEVREGLVPALQQRSDVITLLAYEGTIPVGVLNAFDGFSTFRCKPLLNIHDIAVLPQYRGRGIASEMLKQIEQIARERGCCKLTLEVLEKNHVARGAYEKAGFCSYELDPKAGKAMFWEKHL